MMACSSRCRVLQSCCYPEKPDNACCEGGYAMATLYHNLSRYARPLAKTVRYIDDLAQPRAQVSHGRLPRIRNCGASRRLRLSSAKPENWASMSTAFHNGTASSSLGMREITGPKKDTPSGGANVMIGVPTSRPVRLRARAVSASSSASHL